MHQTVFRGRRRYTGRCIAAYRFYLPASPAGNLASAAHATINDRSEVDHSRLHPERYGYPPC
jgi:hypothetical protein